MILIFFISYLREITAKNCTENFICPDGTEIAVRGNRTFFDGPSISAVGESKSLVPKPLCHVENLVEKLTRLALKYSVCRKEVTKIKYRDSVK